MDWKSVDQFTEGDRVLVKSPDLVDPDYNQEGISEGVLYQDVPSGYRAVCAQWDNTHDCFKTVETEIITAAMLIPK